MQRAISVSLLASLLLSVFAPVLAQRRILPASNTDAAPSSQSAGETKFDKIEAESDGSRLNIRWSMTVETMNAGFDVFAVNGKSRKKLNGQMVAGGYFKSMRPVFDGEYQLTVPAKGVSGDIEVVTVPVSGAAVSSGATSVDTVSSFSVQQSGITADAVDAGVQKAPAVVESSAPVSDTSVKVSQSSLAPDPDTQKWVAARPGVKFGVTVDGVYRVTKAQLQANGFDVNSDPALWQLYVDGREQPISVSPSGDIEFYGTAIDTPETGSRTYFLVVGDVPGKRILHFKYLPSLSPLRSNWYTEKYSMKSRIYYLSSILNGDEGNYFGTPVTSSSPTTVSINLPSVVTSGPTVSMNLSLQGYSNCSPQTRTPLPIPHTVTVQINGHQIGTLNGADCSAFQGNMTFPASYLNAGSNSVVLTATATNPYGQSDFNLLDKITINYPRQFVAQSHKLLFSTVNYRAAEISGFSSSNVRLFDLTSDGQPVEWVGLHFTQQADSSYGTRVPAFRSKLLYAVEDSSIGSPASIEYNNPSTLSTTEHNAQMVIISYQDFMTQANAWADYRRSQGYSVEVVDIRDVYDEFNFGNLGAAPIKAFLQYAKQNWQTPPQYALLLGDATYDPRNYENYAVKGYLPYIPAKLVDTSYGEAPSDDALADFNNDGLAELAIGRIPARTAAEAANVLNKTEHFETISAGTPLNRGALFVYDAYDWDFNGDSHTLANQLPAGTAVTFLGKPDNTESQVVSAINNGPYIVNYSGHGSVGVWAHDAPRLIEPNNLCVPGVDSGCSGDNVTYPKLNNPGAETVLTSLSCLNGDFVVPGTDVLAERFLKWGNGGSAAAWASSGETTPDVQIIMGTRFYQKIGDGSITRLGDLTLDAKAHLHQVYGELGSDVLYSWVLIGDPLLKMR